MQLLNPTVQIKYSLRTLNKKIWLKDCTPEQRGQMGHPALRQMTDGHPSDTAEQQRNSKEARDSQSGNQRTFIRYSSYSDEDQKGHVVTE